MTAYANPGGTGGRRSLVAGSVSSGLFASGNVTDLLDGNIASSTTWFNNVVVDTSRWIKFDFIYPAVIDEAKSYRSIAAYDGTWKWQGSNNDADWYDIGASLTLSNGVTIQTHTTLNNNITAYRFYRLIGVSGNTNGNGYLLEFEFKINYNSTGITPAYGNPGSYGNRPSIAITSNMPQQGGTVAGLLNGSYANAFWSYGNTSGIYIKFDFGVGVKKVISEARWYQSQPHGCGVWKWQGSNDNSIWTNIGANFTLGGTYWQVMTAINGNTTGYRYYRIYGVSGAIDANPWFQEIDFKIGDEITSIDILPTGIPSSEAFGSAIVLIHPGPCRSLTTCQDIQGDRVDNCTSITTCEALSIARPDHLVSLSKVQSIPLTLGGTFLIF